MDARFSDDEIRRRRNAIDASLGRHDLDAAIVYGADRSGSAVGWLTQWPATREAALVVQPGHRYQLFVQFYNHVPNARRLAYDCEVAWGGESTVDSVLALLRARGAHRIGVIGPLRWRSAARLTEAGLELMDLARLHHAAHVQVRRGDGVDASGSSAL